MTRLAVGFAAALEQLPPTDAVRLAAYAESRGFEGVMATDSFQPWTPRQGESSFVWSVLAAIGESTSGDLGPGAVTPSFRWHPAVVAQASATLAVLYPGRHWLGIGPGDAKSEHIVGGPWPDAAGRINQMFEAVDLINTLFAASVAGRDARHTGRYFRLESTRLWTMPAFPPPVLIAASGPVTAKRAGRVADGLLVTTSRSLEGIANLLDRFSDGAREVGKDPLSAPKVLFLHLSWAESDEMAVANALAEWPNGAARFPTANIRSPFEFAQMIMTIRPDDFEDRVFISADLDAHRANIQRFADLGFDRIYLHNVGRNQTEWIDAFGREVLPHLQR